MKRTGKYFLITVVFYIFTFWAVCAFAAEDEIKQTTTGYTIVHPASGKKFEVLVTYNKKDKEGKDIPPTVKRCLPDKPCTDVKLVSQRELYSCIPLQEGAHLGGTKVILKNTEGNDVPYDCQYITATESNKPIFFKSGDNTSCPMIINGRYCDPCAGIF
jgi:hypothetical protein